MGLLEGVSFLILLGVAMPMKYLLGMPLAVRIVGSIHGLLFVVFIAVLVRVAAERGWRAGRVLAGLVAATLPAGTFVFDRVLKRELRSEA